MRSWLGPDVLALRNRVEDPVPAVSRIEVSKMKHQHDIVSGPPLAKPPSRPSVFVPALIPVFHFHVSCFLLNVFVWGISKKGSAGCGVLLFHDDLLLACRVAAVERDWPSLPNRTTTNAQKSDSVIIGPPTMRTPAPARTVDLFFSARIRARFPARDPATPRRNFAATMAVGIQASLST